MSKFQLLEMRPIGFFEKSRSNYGLTLRHIPGKPDLISGYGYSSSVILPLDETGAQGKEIL
jgi:hypothetical protein